MRRALCAALLLLGATGASAHDVKATLVYLDLGSTALGVELQLPVPELQAALHLPTTRPGAPTQLPERPQLERYIREHFSVRTPAGLELAARFDSLATEWIEDGAAVVARMQLTSPPGSSARVFLLHNDLIVHEVINHKTYVLLRRDPRTGVLGGAPEVLGLMHYQRTEMTVDRSGGSAWQAFASFFVLGGHHIYEGSDHLLFLFMLLLPAALTVRARRWGAPKPIRHACRDLLWVASAFTLGHSLTLAVGALGLAHIPTRVVETAIALSILVSAAHAIRPLFPGREAWMAAGFGLVHGLAFATALQGMGVDASTLTVSLLGFNLGIEAMQLVVVAVTLPSLLILSRRALYPWLRGVGAAMGGLAALVWAVERVTSGSTPLSHPLELLFTHVAWAPLLLAVAALASLALGRTASTVPRKSSPRSRRPSVLNHLI